MVHIWDIPDDYPEAMIGEYDRERGPDRFGFKQGKPLDTLPSKRPRITFTAASEKLRRFHDLANNALVPLVSANVAHILEEICPDDVQLIPCEVSCSDAVIEDFSIVVVTHTFRGLDHEKSSYKCVPGTKSIMRFEQAVYKDGCLGSSEAVRDEEYLPNLLISDRLYRALEGLNGIGLYTPREMNW